MNVLDMIRAPWAIEPEVLTEMCAIYARHRNGETIDVKAIEAATGRTPNNTTKPYTPKPYEVQDGVAMIPIEGVLSKRMSLFAQICGGMSYTSLQQDLAQALADPDVISIILTIDSPGGAVDGLEAAGNAIYDARSQKPIAAYVDGKAASAAYWLGSAASQVYIGSDADAVGSIGVIMTHVDTSNAEHQRGVKYTDIAAGRYKTVGSPHAPLSAQDRNTLQEHLDQLYGGFVDTVARNRGTDAKTVLSNMADGRVFLGQRAIDAGLADGKMTLPQLIQKMRTQPGIAKRLGSSSPDRRGVPQRTIAAMPSSTPDPSIESPVSPPKPLTDVELAINRLRPLKEEEIQKRRLLDHTVKVKETADQAVLQAQRQRKSADEIEPYVRASLNAKETLRELRDQLRVNEAQQLAILRSRKSAEPLKSEPAQTEAQTDPVSIASAARNLVAKANKEGRRLSFAQAVAQVESMLAS